MGGARRRATNPHLRFEPQPRVKGRVTRTWEVIGGLTALGEVKWYSHWRRYVFSPKSSAWSELVFDASCLRTLADFCEEKSIRHREARKRLKETKR